MIHVLQKYITNQVGENPPHLEEVLSLFRPLKFKRNEFLVREGDICNDCYFIVKGCVQVFVYDSNANETTRDFVFENGWVMEINSFKNQIPAKENLRAAEATQILGIGRDSFQKMMETVPAFEKIYRQIIELSYANSVFRLNTFIAMDALERIQWMSEHQPKLLQRLSNKMVASYLGISPETLSRLKAKL